MGGFGGLYLLGFAPEPAGLPPGVAAGGAWLGTKNRRGMVVPRRSGRHLRKVPGAQPLLQFVPAAQLLPPRLRVEAPGLSSVVPVEPLSESSGPSLASLPLSSPAS